MGRRGNWAGLPPFWVGDSAQFGTGVGDSAQFGTGAVRDGAVDQGEAGVAQRGGRFSTKAAIISCASGCWLASAMTSTATP